MAGSVGSVTITKPSGVVDGDLMIAILYSTQNQGVGQIWSVPAGWTLVREDNLGINPYITISTYSKVAASEGSSYIWNMLVALTTAGGSILRITDFNTTTPVLASSGYTASGSTTSLTFTDTVTPTNGYHLILFPIITVSSSSNSLSAQAITTSNPTWTELSDNYSSNLTMNLVYSTRPESTPTGDSSATASVTCTSWGAQKIVINRVYAFSSTISDSTTVTDTHVNNVGFNLTVSDSVTPTDTITAIKQKTWATLDKIATTWSNLLKS